MRRIGLRSGRGGRLEEDGSVVSILLTDYVVIGIG